jgi:hypothetical protein
MRARLAGSQRAAHISIFGLSPGGHLAMLRYRQKRERLPGSPDREMRSLAELPPRAANYIGAACRATA